MNKKEVRKHILSIISVSLFLIIATTFVYIPKQENLLSSLAFLQNQQRFYMEELSTGILLKNAIPTSDQKGLENEPYRFKVVNNSNKDITYTIVFYNNEEKAVAKGKEVLPNRYLRYNLVKDSNSVVEPTNLKEDGVLYTTTIKANTTAVFEFKMWLDYNADNGAMNKVFIGTVGIEELK